MKKVKELFKKNIKLVIGFIIGGIVFGTIGVYAATTLLSQSVYYNNTNSGGTSTNVQGALDELYAIAKTCINPTPQTSIFVKLNGAGTKKVLSDYYNGELPDLISVDGITYTGSEVQKTYNFSSSGEHQIIMIWIEPITDMRYMFQDCSDITSIDFSNFDTSNVDDMSFMFYGCSSLTSLALSNFDTSKVAYYYAMFAECSSLTSLDLSSFDTSIAIDYSGMFHGCSSLTSLNLSNFNIKSGAHVNSMFGGTNNLRNVNVCNNSGQTHTVIINAGKYIVCQGEIIPG